MKMAETQMRGVALDIAMGAVESVEFLSVSEALDEWGYEEVSQSDLEHIFKLARGASVVIE